MYTFFSLITILLGVIHTQMTFEQHGNVGIIGPVAICLGVLFALIAIVSKD